VVLVADRADDALAQEYADGLRAAGWQGRVDAVSRGGAGWASLDLRGAAGLVTVAQDPTQLAAALADARFRAAVTEAVRRTPAVLADRHMAAALGTWWSPKADPTDDNYEDEAVANFRTDDAQLVHGLSLVRFSSVPTLTYDYRWGRLFALGQRTPHEPSVGIGEDAALVVSPQGARVVGDGSVAVLDGSHARYWTATNGAIGAVNTVLSTYAPGDRVRP
jgi:cyanophycinase-like exopeptidase